MIVGAPVDLLVLARSYAEGQRYLKQPFSELLIGNKGVRTISHKRGHERTDIVIA